jgi:hypothetical protein
MVNDRIFDLKKKGISQDLKELQKDKGFSKALRTEINRIKSEGKAKQTKAYDKYNKGMKERQEVYSQAEKKTITNPKEYKEYKEKLERSSQFNPRKEKFKAKVSSGISKVGTALEVGLTNATQKIGRKLNERIISRRILKQQPRVTVKMDNRKIENIFEDENRFFKGNFEKEKRSMFLS